MAFVIVTLVYAIAGKVHVYQSSIIILERFDFSVLNVCY